MPDRSQGTSHPDTDSTAADSRVAPAYIAEAATPLARWTELYSLIVDFTAPGRALVINEDDAAAARSLKVGNPISLIAEAESLGGGQAAHAVVSRIRPELLTVDLDGCAEVVAPRVLDAAELVGAPLVHLAASGSPNSVHLVLAPPTAWAHAGLLREIDEIRSWAGFDSRTVDVLTPARYLRLPGSASLKPGGNFCHPIDLDGTPLSPVAAAIRAETALQAAAAAAGDQSTPAAVSDRDADTQTAGEPSVTSVSAATARVISTASAEESRIVVGDVAPRAWRRRGRFSPADWRLFTSHPPVGTRSDRATEAAWRLWQSGIRDWSMAGWYYRNCEVFEKFAVRDTTKPGSSRAHWESVVSRARGHRPAVDAADDAVIGRVRDQLATWTDRPAQAILMLALLENRFTDGHGLTDRPVAVRDVMAWLNLASIGTAKTLLDDLVTAGALAVATPHHLSAPREATTYTLVDPGESTSRTDPEHDVTMGGNSQPLLALTEGTPLSPVWGLLGAACWRLYSQLLVHAAPTPSAPLAAEVGLPVGTRRSGCLHLLDVLVQAHLVTRVGEGRATTWVAVGGDAVSQAEQTTGALDRLKAVRTRINAERSSWHAETRTEYRKAQRVLHRVLDNLRDRARQRQLEFDFAVDDEYSTGGLGTKRPAGLRRRTRNARRPRGRSSGRASP